MTFQIGQKVKGTVSGLQPYGAFVELSDDIQGLIHISELKNGYVENIEDLVSVGDEIDVIIMDIDEYTGKLSLSYRAVLESEDSKLNEKRPSKKSPKKKKKYFPRFNKFGKHTIGFKSLEKLMPTWTQEALTYLNEKNK